MTVRVSAGRIPEFQPSGTRRPQAIESPTVKRIRRQPSIKARPRGLAGRAVSGMKRG